MGKIFLTNYPEKSLTFNLPKVVDYIFIYIYDDVEAFSLTNTSTNNGFGVEVTDNEKNLLGLIDEVGCFEIEINTASGGIYKKEINILTRRTTITFNKIEYDFEIKRVDEECQDIEDVGTNLLSTSFISTDIVRLQYRELESFDLVKDGFSFEDIVWETEGVTDNDGTVDLEENDDNAIHSFMPNPINRQTAGSREPNEAIKYKTTCTIIGLKKEIELEQDGKDVLRQEYVDYNTAWTPTRDEVFSDDGEWNTGNYSRNPDFNTNATNYQYESGFIAAQGDNRFQEIWDELNINYQEECNDAGITTDTGLSCNSCYRNPQRNRAVGSVLINSNHTIGHAMDVKILGARTKQKWILLNKAAEDIEGINGICENGPTQVVCGASNQSHVHLAW